MLVPVSQQRLQFGAKTDPARVKIAHRKTGAVADNETSLATMAVSEGAQLPSSNDTLTLLAQIRRDPLAMLGEEQWI